MWLLVLHIIAKEVCSGHVLYIGCSLKPVANRMALFLITCSVSFCIDLTVFLICFFSLSLFLSYLMLLEVWINLVTFNFCHNQLKVIPVCSSLLAGYIQYFHDLPISASRFSGFSSVCQVFASDNNVFEWRQTVHV